MTSLYYGFTINLCGFKFTSIFTTPDFNIPHKITDTFKKIVTFLGHAEADGLVNAATERKIYLFMPIL